MTPDSFKNFELQTDKNEPKFKGIYSRNNLYFSFFCMNIFIYTQLQHKKVHYHQTLSICYVQE